jgi:hypothetical protein
MSCGKMALSTGKIGTEEPIHSLLLPTSFGTPLADRSPHVFERWLGWRTTADAIIAEGMR